MAWRLGVVRGERHSQEKFLSHCVLEEAWSVPGVLT